MQRAQVAVSEQSKELGCILNRAVQDCGRQLNQSHFRPMAEVFFPIIEHQEKSLC